MKKTFQAVITATEKRYVRGGGDASPDVNGNMPVQFTVIAGQLPARATVISGTIAENLGLVPGGTYVVQCNFRDINEYGDNWNHVKLGQLTPIDLAQLPSFVKAFGAPAVVDVSVEAETESVENKLAEVGADEDF